MSFFSKRKLEIFSGFIFIIIFYFLGYRLVDTTNFFARDDGIITMSHARNLVDYGFIGVNPSGGKVLGFSAPLQFFIYTIFYFIFRINPYVYTIIQTVVCTFFLGYIFSKFFKNEKWSLIYSVFAAIFLTRIYKFLGWHASGMENALVHLFFIWVVYILYNFVKTKKISYYYAIPVFYATIVRFDSVYHIAPLLLIFSIYWFICNKNIKALKFSIIVGIAWILFMSLVYLYFGDFFPHTAGAQGISVGTNIRSIMSFSFPYFLRRWRLSKIIIENTGVILVPLILVPIVIFNKKNITTQTRFVYLICYSLLLTGILNPFIFGNTRIDASRTVTFLSVISILLICLILKEINFKKVIPYTLVIMTVICAISTVYLKAHPAHYLGFSTESFDTNRIKLVSAANDNEIHRATVSNPDLGIVSWHKQFNIVDLGMLGSPLMTYITEDEHMISFYFEYISPDLIETHDTWSEQYSFLWNSDLFNELYEPITEITYYNDDPKIPQGVWIRKDIMETSESDERAFYDKLSENLCLETIEQEFESLQVYDGKSTAYISRTIYKFIPELKEAGLHNGVNDIFDTYDASVFDYYLLNSSIDENAWKLVLEEFID